MNVRLRDPLALALTMLTGVLIPSAVGALSATAPTGFVFGPIVKVNASGFQVTTSFTQTGTATVKLASSTELSQQLETTEGSLKKGVCITAFGTADSKGKVTASSVTISNPSKGKCTGGLGRGPGSGPSGTSGTPPQRPGSGAPAPGGNFGSVGLAIGKVISLEEKTLKVRGTLAGKQVEKVVSITKETTLQRIARVKADAIATKLCAFVVGTSSDNGLTVKAQTIRLSPPSSSGCSGFPPRS